MIVLAITPDVSRVILRYGFMDSARVPDGLRQAVDEGRLTGVDLDALTYFISHETVIASADNPSLPAWREEIFALMQRNAEETASYFCVPTRQGHKERTASTRMLGIVVHNHL